jgi:hypothetical protein
MKEKAATRAALQNGWFPGSRYSRQITAMNEKAATRAALRIGGGRARAMTDTGSALQNGWIPGSRYSRQITAMNEKAATRAALRIGGGRARAMTDTGSALQNGWALIADTANTSRVRNTGSHKGCSTEWWRAQWGKAATRACTERSRTWLRYEYGESRLEHTCTHRLPRTTRTPSV